MTPTNRWKKPVPDEVCAQPLVSGIAPERSVLEDVEYPIDGETFWLSVREAEQAGYAVPEKEKAVHHE